MTMEQFLGLYNYWIVIFLMMTGFYIVIARENLIKTIIGLNIFQTSVFLLYITMGKVHGGTAPILKGSGGAEHGNEEHALHDVPTQAVETLGGVEARSGFDSLSSVETFSGGDSLSNVQSVGGSQILDDLLDAVDAETAIGSVATVGYEENVTNQAAEAAAHGSEVIYSNPIPSVLMLTAIVVGIATTALALALVVRIREEYGTIEEDEILELDRNA